MADILAIIIGYLIGSISPAYILGRLIKKADIRRLGDGNAGTTNVFKQLGILPAVITAIFDVAKGLLAVLVAHYLGASLLFSYLAGFSAVIGHIFPFYLRFRGGQGVATCIGLLFYFLYLLLKNQFLPIESLVVLAAVVLAILAITGQKRFLALVIMPSLAFMINNHYPLDITKISTEIILLYIFILSIYQANKERIFILRHETLEKILPWRTVLRPLAVVFPVSYFFLDRHFLLWAIGIICIVPVTADSIRLISGRINLFFFSTKKQIYKKGEERRFSSISLFLLAAFITILLFPKPIAILALTFVIFGDVFAKFFGSQYGRIKIFGEKTLEGSVAHFIACLLAGYILWSYVGLSGAVIITGIFAATVSEALPLGINDNFSVSLLSASAMFIVWRFFNGN